MTAQLWTHETAHYVVDWKQPLQPPRLCAGAAPGLAVMTWHEDERIIGIAHGKHENDSVYIGCMAFEPSSNPTRMLEALRLARTLLPHVKRFHGVRLSGKRME